MIVGNKNFNIFYQFFEIIQKENIFKCNFHRINIFLFKDYIGNYIMKI